GWTTTGATVLRKLQTVPRAVLFFRAELQWLGGFLTLMTLILVLGPGGAGGLPDRHGRSIEVSGGRERSSLAAIVRDMVGAYFLVTLACLLGLILANVPVFDAVCLAFATVSTGGFVPRDGEVSTYGSAGAEYVMVVFMLVGATSIFWHRSILQGQRHLVRQHRESYFVIAAALAVGFVFAVAMYRTAGGSAVLSPADALREGLFTGVSLMTTSGFESRTHGLTVVPLVFVLFAAFVGGGTFSTAGGIKQYRFGGMLVQAGRELMRLIYPHGVHSPRFGSQAYDIQLMKAIWSYFVVAIAVVAISGILLALEGIEFEGALAVSVGAFSNVTMIYSTGWPEGSHWPSFADMADASRLTLAATMILGRIEVLILLSALNPSYWRT
ncbi:MAG: TrkH family potassium uptake protein, partial [Hyphomicrobiales bacterium]|nr:TrkH family potassium uptake protein [Hyphomicrobiales bacterium]